MPRAADIIDPKTAGTIAGLFRERVRRTPHACAYRHFISEERRFEIMSWNEMSLLAARWQDALEREGLRPGDRVAVILRNCPEWVLFDVASLGLGLVTVPIFADDRPANIAYILKESGSRVVILEEETHWRSVEAEAGLLPEIERIVALHPAFSSHSESDDNEVLSRTNTKCDPRVIGLSGLAVRRRQKVPAKLPGRSGAGNDCLHLGDHGHAQGRDAFTREYTGERLCLPAA